jgi:hypothetical protein
MTRALGCLAHLVIVAALTVVLDRWTGATVAPVLRPWAAFVAASLLVLGASNFLHLLRGYGRGDGARSTLLARATTGEPPADAGPMLVTGRVRADGATLRSPLSGTECVAYQYRLFRRQRFGRSTRRGTTVVWIGYACVPFMIDTTSRAIRVGAMPDLVDDPRRDKTDAEIDRAREYIQITRFDDVSGIDLVSVAATMLRESLDEQRASLRRDWHRAGMTPDPATLHLEEHVLPVGVSASAAGHWSPERQALVPEPGGLGGSPVTITQQSEKVLLRRGTTLPSSAAAVAVFGVLLLVVGGALVWAMRVGQLAM